MNSASVGYIKVRHIYRVLSPHPTPSSCFALILCRIGAFDRLEFLCLCRFFESRAHFRSGLVPENKCRSSLSITAAVERPQVVLQ